MYGTFSLLGGIGNTLAQLVFCFYLCHQKESKNLGLLSVFPSLFNNN
ncbi:hypothetical protein HMPREF0555_0176, partial [Leuconostoc mesenteroides subsp. cremoris ATCC 19254]